jgi:hypothetical protein
LQLQNSIVAGNIGITGADIYAPSIICTGPDIVNQISGDIAGQPPINVAPNLYPYGNYGGPTPTMPPIPGSPAIDTAISTSLATDQRGYPRPVGLGPDLGAVEGTYNPGGVGKLSGVTYLTNGGAKIGFNNLPDISYTVFASTNAALPFSQWSDLGPVVASPANSGNYQFTDPQATNYPQRYYRVRTP